MWQFNNEGAFSQVENDMGHMLSEKISRKYLQTPPQSVHLGNNRVPLTLVVVHNRYTWTIPSPQFFAYPLLPSKFTTLSSLVTTHVLVNVNFLLLHSFNPTSSTLSLAFPLSRPTNHLRNQVTLESNHWSE
jgi:hypothetical protein